MSISPISGGSSDWYSSQSTQNQQPPELNLTDTAQLLGISTTQLDSDLQSGQTLSSLAQTAGVSSSDLLTAVESDLSANAPQGAPTLSSTQLQQFATNLINGSGPGSGHHHSHGAGGAGQGPGGGLTLTDTAQLLGISTSQLSSDLQSGDTLSSLAQTAGVSSSDLLSAVESDLSANAPQGAPTLSSDQLQQFATAVIDGTGPNVGWQGDTGSAYGSDGASGSANSGDLYDNYS